jgi:nucleotide-binding universal stress UspA family protein
MSIKTILAITGTEAGDDDLMRAARLCEDAGVHLSVLIVELAPAPPTGEFAAMVSDGWILERQAGQKRLEDRAVAVTARLAGTAVSADVSTAYPELAWADEVVGRRARYADLTMAGATLLADPVLGTRAVEGAMFSSGSPLMIVPAGATATISPRRVLLAWDAGIEAARAMHAALDLLSGADAVHLTLVDPVEGEDGHGAEPGADAATYLARLGAKVTVDRLPSGGRPIATVLRQHAVDVAADLIVMGAYGHSRLRERMFGGTTKSMLDEATVPVLFAR